MHHGTNTCYQAGCREPSCQDAHRRTRIAWERAVAAGREFQISSERSRRKIGALAALGHSPTRVAEYMGISQQAISRILGRDTILASTAERIDRAYDDLEMAIPVDDIYTRRTKRAALAAGHAPPLAWDDIDAGVMAVWDDGFGFIDDVAIERAIETYDFSFLTMRAEKVAALTRWLALGRSEASLCRLTGWRPGRYRETS